MFRKKKKNVRSLTEIDIERNEGQLYFVREYGPDSDRTVAAFVSKRSAEQAIQTIRKNPRLTKKNYYQIEAFNYVEHQNSLVAK